MFKKLLAAIRGFFLQKNSIHYVNGSETLPAPLTKEEEAVVFKGLSEGKQSCRDALVVHNLRLVVYIAKKFETKSASIEDLVSIGTIGLMKAVNTFAPEKNIKLATYASRCIENEILMYLRKNSSKHQESSINDPLNTDCDGNELLLSDVLGSDQNLVGIELEQNDERSMLLAAVDKLSKREKRIMQLRFGLAGNQEHTQKEVADTIGISQSYISRLEKRIIKRLKNELEHSM
ncbi:MAG: RNA polymerase sporulation sigma factor SigE [Clostridia bacterium]|jgi:RNA polymerase sporulation-specific sigma factor|nr:RNA polymerase sporulation sigma factor SigE [Clostridia bacterium]NLS85042.1 RNA polymerase sporulation sigma factor SigE [Oscillospiraceae bacterium]